jgi:endonuclease III-like uncharacterized protein
MKRNMSRSVLSDAGELLRQHYGLLRGFGPPGEWSTLVRLVLERGSMKKSRDWSWVDETPLQTPGGTATQSVPRLEECLIAAGHAARHAGVLYRLAHWWLRRIGDRETAAAFQQRSLEASQQELRAIRGVSWELADRILLFGGGLDVYPLDRGSMRIAARHGWMEMTAEYEDWQAFFARRAREAGVDLLELAMGNARLGREFCGVQPKCDECPLKTLLPPRGPLPIDGDD